MNAKGPAPTRERISRDSSAVGVVTVDDHAVFRAAAHDVIDGTPGFLALGEASSGEEALSLVHALDPELVLVDLRMPGMNGIDIARSIRQDNPRSLVVLISLEEPVDVRGTISTSGAVAFVRKQDFGPSLLRRLWSTHGVRGEDG